jgi:hypothetical protein
MTSVIRACCPAGAERGRGYVSSNDGDAPAFGYSGSPGPPVAEIEHELEERVAWHEAAHAVVGFMFGSQIRSISIAPPEAVTFYAPQRDPWTRMVCSLAGPAGEDARVRWHYDEPTDSVKDYVERARGLCGGRCDGCSAATAAWQIVGIQASDEAAQDQWRAAELEARRLCTRPDVRNAISRLVDALMRTPRIDGSDAEAIIRNHVKFGELAGKEEHA